MALHATAQPSFLRVKPGLLALVIACCCATTASIAAAQQEVPKAEVLKSQYVETVRPLMQTYCIRCHDAKTETDARLDTLGSDITAENIELWTRVKNELDVGAMPPKKEKRPTLAEQEQVLAWASGSLNRYAAVHLETGGDTLARRINNRAYENMVRTLLDTPPQCIDEFTKDGSSYGYDTVGAGLYTTAYQCEMYMKSAQRTLDMALVTGESPPKIMEVKYLASAASLEQVQANSNRAAAEVKALADDPKSYCNKIKDKNYGGIAKDAVLAHYGKRRFEDVVAAKIDWANDPKCIEAMMDVLKKEAARTKALEAQVDEFQPLNSAGGGIMDPFGLDLPGIYVENEGCYVIRVSMCLAEAKCPLPVLLLVDEKVVEQFTLYDPPSAPRTYEVKVFLAKGQHRIRIQPSNNTIEFIDHVNAMFGANVHRGGLPVWNLKGGKSAPNVLVGQYTMRGPVYDSWPSPTVKRIFTRGLKSPPTREYAEEIVATFMKRAYGGEYEADMAKPFVDLIMSHYQTEKNFVEAVKYGLAAVLCSPRFLYLNEEQRADPARRRPLKANELARRLAYFLWSDLPDDALLASAARGALLNEKELVAQTRRMLKDRRSNAFREAFTTQWLKIDKLSSIPIAPEMYPTFDAELLESAKNESVAFFSELLDKNLSILNFVDSDFAMLNGRLAVHYGIPGITGNGFQHVALPHGAHRGGVLTQASVLIATSNGMVESPVRRGAFVMERLLGVSPGTPPPNVPALDKTPLTKDDGSLFTPLERLSKHRENVSCARCHNKIDPLGAGLENYNAIGSFSAKLALRPLVSPPLDPSRRTTEPPHWVVREANVRGTMIDGTPYNGPEELKRQILKHKSRFLRSLAENLTIYALGRGLELSDRPVLDDMCKRVAADNYGLGTLVEQIVLCDLFRDK